MTEQAVFAEEEFIEVNPCEGCLFAGQVNMLSDSNAEIADAYHPNTYDKSVADVAVRFGSTNGPFTGEATVRVVSKHGEADQQLKAITDVAERIAKCAAERGAPVQGRAPGIIAGKLLRREVTACGAFYRMEDNDVVYPQAIINVTNAPKAV